MDCFARNDGSPSLARWLIRPAGLRLDFRIPWIAPVTLMPTCRFVVAGRGIPGTFIGKHGPTGPCSRPPRADPACGGATDTAGRRRSRSADCQSTIAPRRGLSQWHVVRPFPGRPQAAGGRRRRVAAGAGRGRAGPCLRPEHRQPRPRPAGVRAGVHRIRPPHGRRLPDAAGTAADQDLCRGIRARREGIWRAAGRHRRVLGTGERFRRQHGPSADTALAGVAGVRLPPLGNVRQGNHRRAEDHRPRRSHALRDDRFMGRRTRADAIFADALLQLCGGL